MRTDRGFEGGKFCRDGINCRGGWSVSAGKSPGFTGLFAMARRLLIDRHGSERPRCAAYVGVLSMLFALGAASSAMGAIQSLTSGGSTSPASTGFGESAADLLDSAGASASTSPPPAAGSTGFSQLSPTTMSALLAAQGQSSAGSTTSASTSPTAALQDLFSQIDANGDGQISKTEFENALGAGGTNIAQADDVFGKLDANGDGSVSLGELKSALKGAGGKGGGGHHHVGGSGAADPLTQALQAATSTSTTNSNGSTTTSLTYADGSSVTMMSPPAATSSSSASSSYNLIEQMIQREAHAISFATASQSLSLSA
jgi:EF-hand domain pair